MSDSSHEPMREVRDRLVLAALSHVPFDGWSRHALSEAAKDAGYDQTMGERAFPGGPVNAVEHFSEMADRRLAEAAAVAGLDRLRLAQRLSWLVMHRLEDWASHREAMRRAVTFLSLPNNSLAALRCTWRTVDTIWYAAGDLSADFSFYTKRATLAAVYSSTLFYWLEDESDDFADTRDFLERRLAEAGQLPKLRATLRQRFEQLPNPLRLLFEKGAVRRHFGVKRV